MLTDKQQRFVDEYLIDLNGKQAAIRAGYSAATAEVQASRLLSNAKVAEAVSARQTVIADKLEITQERIAAELAKIGFADIRTLFDDGGRLHHITMIPDAVAAAVQSIEVDTKRTRKAKGDEETSELEAEATLKIKMWDKRAALVDLGKHLGMFTDKLKVSYDLSPEAAAWLGIEQPS